MANVTSTLGDGSVKKGSMLMPGLSCAFESKQKAIAYIAEPLVCKEKMLQIFLEVNVNPALPPLSAVKLLEDDELIGSKHLPDGLFQRLLLQIKAYRCEDSTGALVTQPIDESRMFDLYHVFESK